MEQGGVSEVALKKLKRGGGFDQSMFSVLTHSLDLIK